MRWSSSIPAAPSETRQRVGPTMGAGACERVTCDQLETRQRRAKSAAGGKFSAQSRIILIRQIGETVAKDSAKELLCTRNNRGVGSRLTIAGNGPIGGADQFNQARFSSGATKRDRPVECGSQFAFGSG